MTWKRGQQVMQEQPARTETRETDSAKKAHWETIYATKGALQVSWYAPHLELSLQLIERTGVGTAGRIIDIGGGASTLVDDLMEKGYESLTVLDISSTAMKVSQSRLGEKADRVRWIEGDVTRVDLPQNHFDVWHDRAVFHFLTAAPDRRRYLDLAAASLQSGGQLILATFAHDGPMKCSGLDVVRYSDKTITAEAGESFEFVESRSDVHKTPFNTEQKFLYSRFRKRL
jgi:ubiquinone/menaquinone biosynthesis C-methylase UbiE